MSALLSCIYRTEEQTAEAGMFGFFGLEPILGVIVLLVLVLVVLLIVRAKKKGGGDKQ
jgi:uncharacterized membrane protein